MHRLQMPSAGQANAFPPLQNDLAVLACARHMSNLRGAGRPALGIQWSWPANWAVPSRRILQSRCRASTYIAAIVCVAACFALATSWRHDAAPAAHEAPVLVREFTGENWSGQEKGTVCNEPPRR
jgi:hypothetical protein